jgi:hypothetical protein
MKQGNFDIISKWLIKGFPEYCFGNDKELYRIPHQSGPNHYGLRKISKQKHNRWLILGKFWSERQLKDNIYLNPNPEILIKYKDLPF